MSITGEPDRPPVKAGMSIVDLTTGMFAAYGVLSALFSRQKTGKGQHLDVSLLDGQVMLLNHMATGYLATGKPAGKMGFTDILRLFLIKPSKQKIHILY